MLVEIEHQDLYEIDDAVKIMRLFLREKDAKIDAAWPKNKLQAFIIDGLKKAGQDTSFISKRNLLLLQHSFGPMFRELDKEHPRIQPDLERDVVPGGPDCSTVPVFSGVRWRMVLFGMLQRRRRHSADRKCTLWNNTLKLRKSLKLMNP
jgi:hypothetical protein